MQLSGAQLLKDKHTDYFNVNVFVFDYTSILFALHTCSNYYGKRIVNGVVILIKIWIGHFQNTNSLVLTSCVSKRVMGT